MTALKRREAARSSRESTPLLGGGVQAQLGQASYILDGGDPSRAWTPPPKSGSCSPCWTAPPPCASNAVILQVRPDCDALYESEIEPWSEYLTANWAGGPRRFTSAGLRRGRGPQTGDGTARLVQPVPRPL